MTINFNNIDAAAQQIWQKLDAQDGQDNKIGKTVWDQFREQTGVKANTITNYIEKRNAVNSIKYYILHADETVKQKLCEFIGISTDAAPTAENPAAKTDEEPAENVKSHEQNLREILDEAGLQVTDEEFVDILSKYENKLALKDSLGFTDESIAYDIVNYINAKQKYNPTENQFAAAERAESIIDKAELSEEAQANPYIIEGVEEAAAKGNPKAHAEAYQKFGNGQVQLYDKNGDNKIDKNEFIAYEEQRAGRSFSNEEKQVAETLFDYLKNTNTQDEYIDADEMTLHGYATSKIFDNKNKKTGKDITFLEWKATNDALMDYALGDKDNQAFKAYEGWRNMGKDVIYNYEEILKQRQQNK